MPVLGWFNHVVPPWCSKPFFIWYDIMVAQWFSQLLIGKSFIYGGFNPPNKSRSCCMFHFITSICPLYSPPHSHPLYIPLFGREFHGVDCIYTSPSPFYQPLILMENSPTCHILSIPSIVGINIYIIYPSTSIDERQPNLHHPCLAKDDPPTVAGPIPWKSCGTKARCKHSTSGENRDLTIQNGGSPGVLIQKIMGCRTNTRMVVWWDLMGFWWDYPSAPQVGWVGLIVCVYRYGWICSVQRNDELINLDF